MDQSLECYLTRLRPEAVRAARTLLGQAIFTAEGLMGAGARAVEAEMEREGGNVVIKVDVVTADREQEFEIEAGVR